LPRAVWHRCCWTTTVDLGGGACDFKSEDGIKTLTRLADDLTVKLRDLAVVSSRGNHTRVGNVGMLRGDAMVNF
jgi:hypothetical protein